MFDIHTEVLSADQKIRPFIRETLLDHSVALSKMTGCQIYLKCENLQFTGSFKVRGAMNKLLSLSNEERKQGAVAASSGNHGAAMAYGFSQLNIPGIIFVPQNASSTKIENIRNYSESLEFQGRHFKETEHYAHQYAKEHRMVYVSPYNDYEIVAGQGTIGLELVKQLDAIDVVFVAVGGGGLISGIGGYIKSCSPKTKIIGCLPTHSPVMAACISAGKIIKVETKPTLSDATGALGPGEITFALCQKFVDQYILVSEEEIKNALIELLKTEHLLVEGAAGVAFAALLKSTDEYRNKNCVVILSGSNISLETLKKVLT